MKNKEKYFDDIINYFIKTGAITKEGIFMACKEIECDDCKLNHPYKVCTKLMREWLEEEYKEPITEDEKAILRSLGADLKWLARDESGTLYAYRDKPLKDFHSWKTEEYFPYGSLFLFNHLFQFVKWEDKEPYSIEGLLNEN